MMKMNLAPLRRPVLASVAFALTTLLLGAPTSHADYLIGDFEDQYPGTDGFRNDFRPTGSFQTGAFTLNNSYDADWDSWFGFAVSSRLDNTYDAETDLSYDHLYGAYAPAIDGRTGSDGSATYAVADSSAFGGAFINLPEQATWVSIDLTNTTYAAQSILEGDGFARAFRPGDWFRLDILGYSDLDGTGRLLDTISFYLADYRGDTLQFVSDWTTVGLDALADARSLAFEFASTDIGQYGMNTPATFAIDNLIAFRPSAVPEPSSLLLVGVGLAGLIVQRRRLR